METSESEGLIPTHITTQGLLNEWEQSNILEADQYDYEPLLRFIVK